MSDPEREYLNDSPFWSEGEYLEALFVVLDLLLFEDPKTRLEERGLSLPQDPETWIQMVSDRLEMTESAHGTLPEAEEILSKLDAPYYMRYLLAFLLRCAIDPSYEGRPRRKPAARASRSMSSAGCLRHPLSRMTPPPSSPSWNWDEGAFRFFSRSFYSGNNVPAKALPGCFR